MCLSIYNLFPRLFETTPAGISRKQFQHFGQLITSGKTFSPQACHHQHHHRHHHLHHCQHQHYNNIVCYTFMLHCNTYRKFQQFDYKSKSENLRRYKSKTPPEYNLRNVRVPMQLFYGNRDLLMAKQFRDQTPREFIPQNRAEYVANSVQIQMINYLFKRRSERENRDLSTLDHRCGSAQILL
ncbi:hypothetical protein FF38_11340 [Lucilia cuprina]|uniref:Uncharacterized protein n=1 Tax=Lucilia cuprina TaxID=7375 RepID=A0A0L0C638_LUCCU|nr:hypothetical protein FF38_11340 [Lucilia cuprina]